MKRALPVTAVILSALLLAGCSSTMGGQSSSRGAIEPAPADGTPGSFAEGTTTDIKLENRDIVTSGSVSITADSPIDAADAASGLVDGTGGRIDSRTEQPATETQSASASLVIRMPAGKLDTVLADLKRLGTVNYVSISATDVTQQTQDLDARITALETSVGRLLALMSQATNTTDLIAIESALSQRQSELDSLTTQRDYLNDQIDFSTLNVDFISVGTIAPGAPDSFWGGLVAGWNSVIAFLGGSLIVIGVLLPWLALLAVVGGIVLLIVLLSLRGDRARRQDHSGVSPQAPSAPPENRHQ
ncbi:DUF4349 domain-containing protein [Luethyella okanaganae]|uniref:DUF4349 domain-containing protein n=1 Tax=Luethyella okanaganae TaxID=69372 RepID=A0ABW1VGY8_9MICO